MAGPELSYRDNLAAFRRDLDAVGRDLFPRAMATHINNATFQIKRALDAYTLRAVGRPNKFTQKAWSVLKAKASDGDKMFAEIRANPKQAQYLWWLVMGGVRSGDAGDAGTNTKTHDLFAWTKMAEQWLAVLTQSDTDFRMKHHADVLLLRQGNLDPERVADELFRVCRHRGIATSVLVPEPEALQWGNFERREHDWDRLLEQRRLPTLEQAFLDIGSDWAELHARLKANIVRDVSFNLVPTASTPCSRRSTRRSRCRSWRIGLRVSEDYTAAGLHAVADGHSISKQTRVNGSQTGRNTINKTETYFPELTNKASPGKIIGTMMRMKSILVDDAIYDAEKEMAALKSEHLLTLLVVASYESIFASIWPGQLHRGPDAVLVDLLEARGLTSDTIMAARRRGFELGVGVFQNGTKSAADYKAIDVNGDRDGRALARAHRAERAKQAAADAKIWFSEWSAAKLAEMRARKAA